VITASGLLALMYLPLALPLSLLSGGSLALVALRNSLLGTWSVLMLVLLAGGSFLWVLTGLPQTIMALLALWLPVMLCAAVLRNTQSLALSMFAAGLCAIALMIVIYTTLQDPAQMWQQILERMLDATELGVNPEQLSESVEVMSRHMTGIVAAGFMLNVILCVIIGRAWQARLYNPGAFRREFMALRLGRALTLVFVVLTGVTLVLQSAFVAGLLVLFLGLYLFQGIAVAHAWVELKGGGTTWLVLFYALLVIVWQVLALVSLFGMIDAWIDVRSRWSKKYPLGGG
jgi:hypothetical protein